MLMLIVVITNEQIPKTEVILPPTHEAIFMGVMAHKAKVLGYTDVSTAFHKAYIDARLGITDEKPAVSGSPEDIVNIQKRLEVFKSKSKDPDSSEIVQLFSGNGRETEELVDLILGLNDIPSPATEPDGPPVQHGNSKWVNYTYDMPTYSAPENLCLVKRLVVTTNNLPDGTSELLHTSELYVQAINRG